MWCGNGSPRVHADLIDQGWRVSVNTVADSMRRQGLAGRKPKRRRGLTRQDRKAAKSVPNQRWCGDIFATDEEKLHLSSMLDLCGAAFAACPMSDQPDAELAGGAIKMAATGRGGKNAIDGVILPMAVDQPTLQAISRHYAGDLHCRQSSTKSMKNASMISGEADFLISKLMASVVPVAMN